MKLLQDVHDRYVQPIWDEADAYIASSAYAPIARLLAEKDTIPAWDRREERTAAQEARAQAIELELTRLTPYTFADGVSVADISFYEDSAEIHVEVVLVKDKKRLRVEVVDQRQDHDSGIELYRQEFEVPHEFYKLISKRCFHQRKCGNKNERLEKSSFVPAVTRALALQGMELYEYDRAAKLRALAEVLAA